MGKTTIRVQFDDPLDAAHFLQQCRKKGLDAELEDSRPQIKRNGPALAAWLKTHPGWYEVGESVNRTAANKAVLKIRNGERRGFESGKFEARMENRDGRWLVYARHIGRPARPKVQPTTGMDPLF
ncbi:hypothetical protein BMYO_1275 [Bifidobacterium myosotis]|uniref:Uncharacterized protein n=1 Tax=Bifidobacterium myosotis TaxID=1630166 RepID=A0A261FKL9_9BIFI|nr:hypothetical protein [Bifidobacterium myosotis]KAA8829119.1 hypothetical protein EMO91_03830 [Bifidobacterium myosotis]OZG59707.1 hypothetical protein BMYO_1275 [Bifidobacterium myosotis]